MSHRFPALLAAIPLIAVLGSFQPAHANGQKTIEVKATVSEICKIAAGNVTLGFGALDPSNGDGNATATTNLSYNCTNKTAAVLGITGSTVTTANGTATTPRQLKKGNGVGQSFNYSLTWNTPVASGLGFGPGTAQNVQLTGSIARSDVQNAEGGDYTDSVVFTITP